MTTALYPSLAVIERELFGCEAAGAPVSDMEAEHDPMASPAAMEMPAYLRDLVARRVAADRAYPAQPPAVGQIRRVLALRGADGATRELGRTCAVLLGHWRQGRNWSGWLVVQESNYASERDLVLQGEDAIMAPECAMVQAWNPVEIALNGDEAILGKLPAERLGAVMKLADPHVGQDTFVAARPGRIGAWDIDADTTVVTGTPLGETNDPRRDYQQLYRRLAEEFSRAADAGLARAPAAPVKQGWFERLYAGLARPAWAFALLALAVAPATWVATQRGAEYDTEPAYRSTVPAVQANACRTQIRISFKLATSYADMVLVLRRADVTVVNGPSESGDLWVLPPAGQDAAELAAMLRENHLVMQADVIPPDQQRCAK